jgi:hypothetical protein
LIRKDPHYYKLIWPEIPNGIPYLWPSKEPYVSQIPLSTAVSTHVLFLLCVNDLCPSVFRDKTDDRVVDRYSTYDWSTGNIVDCPHCSSPLESTDVDGFNPFMFTFERRLLETLRAQGKRDRVAAERSGITPGAVL